MYSIENVRHTGRWGFLPGVDVTILPFALRSICSVRRIKIHFSTQIRSRTSSNVFIISVVFLNLAMFL